jgi:hypothetical protein
LASEENFQAWATAPGQTEQAKCDHAVSAVRNAINDSDSLRYRNIRVFAQGSYRNRTNVRQDSDVDVCVLCEESVFFDLPPGTSASDFNVTVPAPYSYPQFNNEVSSALNSYFVNGHVVRGNKAFDIRENTYRIAADAVPCFVYRNFARDRTDSGVAFQTGKGQRIVNWPEQNYANGVAKNTSSGQRFKDVTRILKRLRYKMDDDKLPAARPIPSFLIECLAYNVPDETLRLDTYTAVIRATLVRLYHGTKDSRSCANWYEVNGRKLLFGGGQAWTCEQVNAFVLAAWSYLGFG